MTAVFDEKSRGQDKDDREKGITGILIDAADFGSGKSFDWTGAKETLNLDRRWRGMDFILAGGLNPGNVEEGIRIFEPDIVDVSSGVEGEAGKDREKIKQFVYKVQRVDYRD
jgi:phosphoribosylanthranilate isomerase